MNEVSKIHLGRQSFTISVEAYKNLRQYLDAINKQVKDKDVVDEIELRMAELLTEHGAGGEKVVLQSDIDFLKDQLGNPQDFTEEASETATPADGPSDSKKLFRDTENGMVAGVAAGLAKYTGIDVLIIRIIFAIAIFTGGWGIVLYVVLWLLVPEAKTSSDRLQMAGKPVTVDSLKEIVERADVKGVASRTNKTLAGPINAFFRIVLKIVGIIFVFTGLSTLLGLIGVESYVLSHSGSLVQDNVFPVGYREHLLLDISLFVMGIISIFVVLLGIAMFRRKWPIRAWVTGVLIGLVFIGFTVGVALAVDVVPQVRDRYNANTHITVRQVEPFKTVSIVGGVDGGIVRYKMSDKYQVSLSYFDQPNVSALKTTVKDGVLLIDAQDFDWHRNCKSLCIPNDYHMVITIESPNPPEIPDTSVIPGLPKELLRSDPVYEN